MGYEKNMSFLVIAKSPKVWKQIEKIGLGSFKLHLKLKTMDTLTKQNHILLSLD